MNLKSVPSHHNCIFCKIISKSIPAKIVKETDDYIAFYDINPRAKIHILIVPKAHKERPEELTQKQLYNIFQASYQVATLLKIENDGYKLLFNVGKNAGQEIDHVHLHLLNN